MQASHQLSLEELFYGLSDTIAGIIEHPDTPENVRGCVLNFACGLRSSLSLEKQQRLELQEIRQILPLCLTLHAENDSL